MLDYESCKKVHAGNGLTRTWSYDFPLPDADYMKVYVSGPSSAQKLVPASEYRVETGAKMVVYPASVDADALPSGWTLTLMRELPLLQPITLLNQQGRFFAADTEKGLDRVVMMIQQLAERLSHVVPWATDDGGTIDDALARLVSLLEAVEAREETAIRLYNSIFFDIVGPNAAHMDYAVQLVGATAQQMVQEA